MPDGQSGVLENLDGGVNVVSLPLTAPIAVMPQYERPAYVPEDYKWGSAAVGTSGGTITWAVVSAGQTYPSSEYTSAAQAISSVFMPTIRAAFSRWDDVGNFTFVESSNPMTADIVVMFDELSGEGSSTIGLAHTYYSAGVVRDSYISFDIGRRYRLTDGSVQIVGSPTSSSTSDFYTLVLHEVGHALGLDHEDDYPTVMGTFQNSSITDLTSDEINGIRYLYGTPGGAGADDWGGTTATTGAIIIGASVIGNIETAGDSDWFRVTLTAGVTYQFDMLGGGSLTNPFLNLRNSNGVVVGSDDDSGDGLNARLTYTPTSSGVYFVDARSASATGTGFYGVLVTQANAGNPNPSDDYAGSTSTAGTITVGGTVTGNIEVGDDRDWFRVTLTAGVTYRVDLNGGTLADPLLYIRNSSGTSVASDDDSGPGLNATLSYTPTTTGTYYIDAQGATLSGTGTYTLSLTQTSTGGTSDDVPGTATTTTATVSLGTPRTGNIEVGTDTDWFRVSMTAGTTYYIDIRGVSTGGGTLEKVAAFLNTPSNIFSALNGYGYGNDARFAYTPTTSGVHYLQVMSGGTAGTSGTYTINFNTNSGDDFAETNAGAASLTVGGTRAGNIEVAGDHDRFAVALTAGVQYQIDVRGSPSGGGTLANTAFMLLGGNGLSATPSAGGALAFTNDSGGTGADARLTFTPTSSGTYYVEAYSGTYSATGTYTVSVVQATAEFPADSSTTGSVAVGGTLTSSIGTAADVDWIRVSLTAGTLYRFDARGSASSGGTLADPALQLLNSSGTVLVADNDSGTGADSRIMFQAGTSGTYYLAMRSNSSTATGTYTVAATANPDDYAANTGTTGTVAVGSAAEGLVETAGDRDWFRTTLTANTTYTIRLSGTAPGSALRWTESQFYIRDASAFQLATATNSGLGASAVLTYTPSATGTYIIDTLAYSSGVGSYTLSVTAGSASTTGGLTEDNLAAITAPPAIMLDEPPLQLARSTTVFVDDSLSAILNLPPPDLFAPPAEQQNPFTATTPLDRLFQQQISNPYNLLPF